MTTSSRSLAGVAVAVALVAAAAVTAQTLTRVADIRADPKGYSNVVVTVEGFVTQWEEGQGTTSFYFLKDDWGDVVKVRTSGARPTVGGRFRVSGPVGIDVVNRSDTFISEEQRVELVAPAAAPPATPPPTPPPAERYLFDHVTSGEALLMGGIALALAVLVPLVVWLLRSRRLGETGIEPAPGALDDGSEAPPQVVEGRTIKLFAPPPGTLKILPGRLEVVEGDEAVREIRFYRVRGQVTPEVTFGRVAGPPFTHVQLKPMTVSGRQAKLTFINNQWILTNFAADTSNPTRHNGQELPVDGQVALAEGDRVEMGEVALVFHLA